MDEIFISGDPTKSSDAAQLIGRALFEIAPVQSIDIFSAHLDSEIGSLSSNASECIYKAVLNLNNCPEHPVINRIVSEHLAIFKRQIAKGGNKAVSKPVFPLLCLARFCPDDVKHQVVEALNAFIKSNPPAEIGQLAFLALLNIGGTRAHGCLEKIPAHPGWEKKLNDDASCIKIFGQTILENYLNEGVASQVLLDGLNAKESASKAKPSTHLQLCLENHSLKSLTTGFSSAQLQSLSSSLFLAPAKYGKALSRLFQLSTFSCQQPVSTWSGFTFRLLTGIKRSKPVTHNPLEEELADRLKEAEAQARKPAAIDRPNLLSELEEEGWRLSEDKFPFGRSLVYAKGDRRTVIKFLNRKEARFALYKQNTTVQFLNDHKDELELSYDVPVPKGVFQFGGLDALLSTQDPTLATEFREKIESPQEFGDTAYVYECSPDYLEYLHEASDPESFGKWAWGGLEPQGLRTKPR